MKLQPKQHRSRAVRAIGEGERWSPVFAEAFDAYLKKQEIEFDLPRLNQGLETESIETKKGIFKTKTITTRSCIFLLEDQLLLMVDAGDGKLPYVHFHPLKNISVEDFSESGFGSYVKESGFFLKGVLMANGLVGQQFVGHDGSEAALSFYKALKAKT